jgi:hypothetical protein
MLIAHYSILSWARFGLSDIELQYIFFDIARTRFNVMCVCVIPRTERGYEGDYINKSFESHRVVSDE